MQLEFVVILFLIFYRHILGPWLMHQFLYKWFFSQFSKYKIQPEGPRLDRVAFDQEQSIKSIFLDFLIVGIVSLMISFGIIKKELFLFQNLAFSAAAGLKMFLQIILLFFIQDLYFYLTHRAFHQIKFLKRFHFVHHSSVNPTPWTSFSHHWVEGFTELLFYPLVLSFLPVDILTVLVYVFLSTQINFLGHCGFEFEKLSLNRIPGFSWVMRFEDHNKHHQKFTGNYALYFRIWDKIFNTRVN